MRKQHVKRVKKERDADGGFSPAKSGASIAFALGGSSNYKNLTELDARWQEFEDEYRRTNSKFNVSSSGFDNFWIETQQAMYRKVRRQVETEERIQAKVSAAEEAKTTTQQPPSGVTTYVSNITLPSGKTAQVRFADGVSQSQAEEILRQLAAAKGAAA